MKKIVHVFTVSMSIIFLEDIYDKLRNNGYELIVICSDGDEVRDQEKLGNIKFYPVNMSRGINPIKDLIALFRIILIFINEKPHIVHGHTPKGGLLAMLASRLLFIKNRPYHLHGLKYPSEKGVKRFLIKWMEKTTIQLSSKVFVVSRSLRDYAIDCGLGSNAKFTVLLNGSVKGIDINRSKEIRNKKEQILSKLGIESHEVTLGFIGRITEEKGVFELLDVYKRLVGMGYDIGFVLCGTDEIKLENNRQIFNEIKNTKGVQYFGQVNKPLEYMVCCDIFVLPSWREGFGLVNIEANSVGVPVITTDIVGCRDSIEDGVTGIAVKPKDKDDLYDAIKELIDNPLRRKTMGKNGIKRVQNLYDRNKLRAALINEYNMMVRGDII